MSEAPTNIQMSELPTNIQTNDTEWKTRRRSRFIGSWEAVKQISAALSSKELKIRKADRITDFLMIGTVAMITFLFLFPHQALPIMIFCYLFSGLTIIFYVTQRLGIFASFNERQTLITAELLFGMLWVGIFTSLNIGALILMLKELITNSSGSG